MALPDEMPPQADPPDSLDKAGSFALKPAPPPVVLGFAEGPNFMLPPLLPPPSTSMAGSGLSAPRRLVALSDAALLARLLDYIAAPDRSAAAAAQAIRRFGSFAAVLNAPEHALSELPGLHTQGVAAIKLVHAAALRLSRAAVIGQPVLDGSAALINYLTAMMARDSVEQFRILFLDAKGRLRADEAQARGTVNHTPVYPREVVRRTLELKAVSIILVHNHPSGDPSPSTDDIAMTAMIQSAAEAVGVAVADHIIVGNGRWISFRQEGLC